MLFRSRREGTLWLLAAGYTLLIYVSLGSVRPVTDWLRERNLLRAAIALAFLLAMAAVVTWMVRRRPGWREWGVLAVAAAAYASLLPFARRAEEQLHLLEYGLLGGLLYAAAAERRPAGPRAAAVGTAVLLTTLLGWVDEGIQDLLPDRYYGLQDVIINAVSGGFAAAALAALEAARERSPAGSRLTSPPGSATLEA